MPEPKECKHDIQYALENQNDLESIELICIKCKRVFKDENEVLSEGRLLGLQEAQTNDRIFINHIESHDEVKNVPRNTGKAVCKICNRTAEEIIKSAMKKVKE